MATAGTTGDERWMAMVGWLTGYTPYGKGTLSVTVLTGLNCKGNNHKPGEPLPNTSCNNWYFVRGGRLYSSFLTCSTAVSSLNIDDI